WEYDGWATEKNGYFRNIWPSLINTAPNPGSGCVVNGVSIGAGAAGTGCSLAGFVVPANYKGTPPEGIYRNTINNVVRDHAPWTDVAPELDLPGSRSGIAAGSCEEAEVSFMK